MILRLIHDDGTCTEIDVETGSEFAGELAETIDQETQVVADKLALLGDLNDKARLAGQYRNLALMALRLYNDERFLKEESECKRSRPQS